MKLDAVFVIRFLLAALAVYRLAWMLTREDGPFGLFAKVRAILGRKASKAKHGGWAWTLAEVANCPHCLGIWLAILFAPAVIWPSVVTDVILLILALAGLHSYLTGRTEDE